MHWWCMLVMSFKLFSNFLWLMFSSPYLFSLAAFFSKVYSAQDIVELVDYATKRCVFVEFSPLFLLQKTAAISIYVRRPLPISVVGMQRSATDPRD